MPTNDGRHPNAEVADRLSSAAKISLFRSLFRGREDVFARRFVSSTGRVGFAPACANEWVRGICRKPQVSCSDCGHQRFLPMNDEVVYRHLAGRATQDRDPGRFAAGLYPLLRDETCHFLVLNLDHLEWVRDAQALAEVSSSRGVPMLFERRDREHGRAWCFFESAVPAALARRLGAHLVTEVMELRPEVGFVAYDAMSPAEDRFPRDGFGRVVPLPLQKAPRDLGESALLDDAMACCLDPWPRLQTVRRIDRERIEAIVRSASHGGRVWGATVITTSEDGVPPATPRMRLVGDPSHPPVKVTLAEGIRIEKEVLPPALRNRLRRLAAFKNPAFDHLQSMRLPVQGTPRILCGAAEDGDWLFLPRGCLDDAVAVLRLAGLRPEMHDERCGGHALDRSSFRGELRPEQLAAARALQRHDAGVLLATAAFGKTVVAAWLIAQRNTSTLILVNRRKLAEQWVARLSTFLGLSPESIGRLGGNKQRPTGRIDVAVIQSLVRGRHVDARLAGYGQVVFDECHHVAAPSFEDFARQVKSRFVLGLTATLERKDGRHPVVLMQCGPVRHRAEQKSAQGDSRTRHGVQVCPTAFDGGTAGVGLHPHLEFAGLCRQLVTHDARNRRICDDVVESLREGRSPLVLTERNDHLDDLARRLLALVPHVVVLRGGLGVRERRGVLEHLAGLPREAPRVLLATGRFIGEGFDDPRLDTLFLTFPISWRGTIAQYAGRLHRRSEDKREVRIRDYADLDVPVLARMFERRCRAYAALGYAITLPPEATSGWPQAVSLPVDPPWRRDYVKAVRRLARDGVDQEVATLFVNASRPAADGPGGLGCARSAAEAFLFRRLETLPETKGRFQLNVPLSIAFDGQGVLEVDLLCDEGADRRIAIELDGDQHLDDPVAYRRDRRKDLLLQENGFLVLRFLARDVAKDLGRVLDTLLRVLPRRPTT